MESKLQVGDVVRWGSATWKCRLADDDYAVVVTEDGCCTAMNQDSVDSPAVTLMERDGKPWPPKPEYPETVWHEIEYGEVGMPFVRCDGSHVSAYPVGRRARLCGDAGPWYWLAGYVAKNEDQYASPHCGPMCKFAVWRRIDEQQKED